MEKNGIRLAFAGDVMIGRLVDREMARRPRVDLVVLSIHWGPNMVAHPPPAFRDFARKAAAAGVDILHGHSAHVFQGIERIGRSLILYDTGDFIDDYVVEEYLRNDLTFLYLVRAERAGPGEVELVPARIDRMQVNRASGEDYRHCVDRMAGLCRELGTEIRARGGKVEAVTPAPF